MDVKIKGTGGGDLRKRQYTMHMFCNAERNNNRGGYIVLSVRGKLMFGERFSAVVQRRLLGQETFFSRRMRGLTQR